MDRRQFLQFMAASFAVGCGVPLRVTSGPWVEALLSGRIDTYFGIDIREIPVPPELVFEDDRPYWRRFGA